MNEGINSLLEYLNEQRDVLMQTKEPLWVDEVLGMLYTFGAFKIYKHRITVNDFFDIFICENIPNNNTPRIHIQLRAIALWERGEKETIIPSF